ncbi:MAG: NAD+ synthase [Alphaproteobacteria bacterium]|nr:NAD+ synthase [Alphaproteobacteria bacterium]
MSKNLRITLGQLNPTVGDIEGNKAKILEVWAGNDAETDLVVFPELFLCGYPPEDLVMKPSFLDAVEDAVTALCEHSLRFSSAALIPAPWRMEIESEPHQGATKKTFNAALLIENGQIRHIHAKQTLPTYGVFDEMRVFTSGTKTGTISFRDHKIGLMICEDVWNLKLYHETLRQNPDFMLIINASPYTENKQAEREAMLMQTQDVPQTGVIYLNMVGGQDDLVFDGRSLVRSAAGDIQYTAPAFEEEIINLTAGNGRFKITQGRPVQALEPLGLTYRALTTGLSDYARKNNFTRVLLGLSGGIDSALTATIAADALGPENVRCIMMPSRFTSQASLEDAQECAELLGVHYEVISISEIMTAFERTIPSLKALAHENMQSRARGAILMSLSNMSGELLLSTGNKSELATGYATLYGDMCGGFDVLKDLYKSEVYPLCVWRNREKTVIPQKILSKEPSAELRDNQRDRDSLPPYPFLDDILAGLIEGEMSVEEVAARGHDPAIIKKIWNMLCRNEYKRRQGAPGVKVSSRAFGRDRRYPITNKFLPAMDANED